MDCQRFKSFDGICFLIFWCKNLVFIAFESDDENAQWVRERETKDNDLFSTIKLRQTCKDRKEASLIFFGYKQLLEGAQSSIMLN